MSHDDRLMLWERVHKEVARHRRFAEAEWSMADEPLTRLQNIADRLEPIECVERFAYLFDWHPDLPGANLDDYASYEARLISLRVAAIEETLRTASIERLRQLAQRPPVPSHFGLTLGSVSPDDLDDELFSWLTPRTRSFGSGGELGISEAVRPRRRLIETSAGGASNDGVTASRSRGWRAGDL